MSAPNLGLFVAVCWVPGDWVAAEVSLSGSGHTEK